MGIVPHTGAAKLTRKGQKGGGLAPIFIQEKALQQQRVGGVRAESIGHGQRPPFILPVVQGRDRERDEGGAALCVGRPR